MSARTTIDSLRFASLGERLSGEFAMAEMPRLENLLSCNNSTVTFSLSGEMLNRRPALRLKVRAEVKLICQRCLEPFVTPLESVSVMPVARDEAELARWEREDALLDILVADPQLDVRELVEDEILLSLPPAPRHADGYCGSVPTGSA
jgi:uncharacterized protein